MDTLSSSEVRKHSIRVSVRSVTSVVLLVTLYYVLPLDGLDTAPSIFRLIGILALLFLGLAWQIRSIVRSPLPEFRAVEVVAVLFPLVILLPSAAYVLLSKANTQAFSEYLSRTDALYFAVTVFSTVGFGDITPLTQSARIAVTAQVLVNLLLLGIGLRIVLGAVSMGKQRRRSAP